MFTPHKEKYMCFFHPITTVKSNIQREVFCEGSKQFRRGAESKIPLGF
jgi:hypothetical protein